MKIIVAAETAVEPNIVRGALGLQKVAGIDVLSVRSKQQLVDAVQAGDLVMVDWEGDPGICADMVRAVKSKNDSVPVLLLSTKAKAGTTFSGIKAGAAGVINKPIDSEDLVRSVAAAVKRGQTVRPTVNVEFINPFIEATRNVFSTMCKMEIQRKSVFLKDDYKMLGDISGVMSLSGAAVGSVVVSMPADLACLVVGNMLGEAPAKDLTPDVRDATGELINMIAGQAKASLVKTKYHFTISIPTVVTEPGQEIEHQKGAANIVVLFEGGGYDFSLQVCLAPHDEPAAEASQ